MFLESNIPDLQYEMVLDLYYEKEQLMDRLEHGAGDQTGELMARLNILEKALQEEEYSSDPLIDKWERDIAEGRTPDLNEEM